MHLDKLVLHRACFGNVDALEDEKLTQGDLVEFHFVEIVTEVLAINFLVFVWIVRLDPFLLDRNNPIVVILASKAHVVVRIYLQETHTFQAVKNLPVPRAINHRLFCNRS